MAYVQSWLAHRASPQAEVAHLHHACNGRRPVLRIAHRGVQASAHRIALLPGDGIGPEIADVAVRLLRAAGELEGESFEVDEGLIGGAAIDATGQPLPAETMQLCRDSDAVLLAAIGGCGPTGACCAGRGTAGGPPSNGRPRRYKWDALAPELRPERGLLSLREGLQCFANLRPARVLPQLVDASSLKREVVEGVDIMIVRELVGGIYFGQPRVSRGAGLPPAGGPPPPTTAALRPQLSPLLWRAGIQNQ